VSKTASAVVTVANKLGLHARPATLFVQTASNTNCDVTVRRADQDESVDGKSVMQMMMLAATQGTKIEITAVGADAKETVATLVQLVESGFQED
jgi:phosphocarrier protein